MPPGGWGRRAAGRIDQKLEDDALFKEIGGQLDANFDYSQWQRAGKPAPGNGRRRPPFRQENAGRPTTVGSGFTSSSGLPHRHVHSASSSCHCRQWKPNSPVLDEAAEKRRSEAIKILQLRIRARRQTIEEYRKRQLELLDYNCKLRKEIEVDEAESHDAVKKLLRKYERFRGGIATLNTKFDQELIDAKLDLEKTKEEINAGLAGLQSEVKDVDSRLLAQQQELKILINYKDKEYPVKALRISDLQKELDQLKLSNDEEEEELHHVVEGEVEKMKKRQEQIQQNITQTATQTALSQMDPNLEKMAMQNLVMVKEIEFHKQNVENLEAINEKLDVEVKGLRRDPKTNVRLQMFPEFFPTREKCTPDMDVILDIPTQEWLPI